MTVPALTVPKLEEFVQHYCVHGHAGKAAAAINVSYTWGKQLLRRPDVIKRVQEVNEQQFAHVGVTAETLKAELARVAFQSARDLYDDEGNMIPIHELPDDVAATIAGIDVEVRREAGTEGDSLARRYEVLKIRRVDKMAAIGLLSRHFKIVGAEDDGVNALANVLADRLTAAKRRLSDPENLQNVSEARIIEPQEVDMTPDFQPAERAPRQVVQSAPLDVPLPMPPKRPRGRPRKHPLPPTPTPAPAAPTQPTQENDDEERLW